MDIWNQGQLTHLNNYLFLPEKLITWVLLTPYRLLYANFNLCIYILHCQWPLPKLESLYVILYLLIWKFLHLYLNLDKDVIFFKSLELVHNLFHNLIIMLIHIYFSLNLTNRWDFVCIYSSIIMNIKSCCKIYL